VCKSYPHFLRDDGIRIQLRIFTLSMNEWIRMRIKNRVLASICNSDIGIIIHVVVEVSRINIVVHQMRYRLTTNNCILIKRLRLQCSFVHYNRSRDQVVSRFDEMNSNIREMLTLTMDQDTETTRKSLSTFTENTRENLKSISRNFSTIYSVFQLSEFRSRVRS